MDEALSPQAIGTPVGQSEITRAEYDAMDSNGVVPCPDCGQRTTRPYPGCHCPSDSFHGYSFTRHINKWHHDCSYKP